MVKRREFIKEGLLVAAGTTCASGLIAGNNSDYSQEGHHLYWMNKLAVTGLFGFIPFVMILIGIVKFFKNLIQRDYLYYYIISFLSIVLLGLMKNVTGREVWFTFFVIIPGINYLNKSNDL